MYELLKNPVVVCVDDEAIILMSLMQEIRDNLESSIGIETFTNPKDAVEFVSSYVREGNDVLLVITDQMMPFMSGDELLEKVHAISPETYTAMLTGYSNIEAIKNAVNKGSLYRYISKPWDINFLREIVEDSIRSFVQDRIIVYQRGQIEKITFALLSALETASMSYDHDLGLHVQRVAVTAELLAQKAGYDEAFSHRVKLYAPVHDIGKIGIAHQLMNKNARYTPEEFEIMKQHVIFGGKILQAEGIDPVARNISLYHHEKWDGSGYCSGLKGEEIPLEARIVSIADVFDALLSKRSYKDPFSEDEAFRILREGRGTHFDPTLIDVFFNNIDQILSVRAEFER